MGRVLLLVEVKKKESENSIPTGEIKLLRLPKDIQYKQIFKNCALNRVLKRFIFTPYKESS